MDSTSTNEFRISVVTPTFRRPREVEDLLENLSAQTTLPAEVIIVDGAAAEEVDTENRVAEIRSKYPFHINYVRHSGGTATQRNVGVEAAKGSFIALIDDDVRLEADFFKNILSAFAEDDKKNVGGIVGYRTNRHFSPEKAQRWRWYKRLGLLSVYEPGRYDFMCGYPINNNMQPPFKGTRRVDFMTTACAVWRRDVFDSGLRFDPFFADYGVLEDAHFSLRAGHAWALLQSGDARCEELHSPNGRVSRDKIGYKCVVNYYFVFQDLVRPLSLAHKMRFWRFQAFELFRIGVSAVRRRSWGDLLDLGGRLKGISTVLTSRNKFQRNF
jgi:glycosyltransferase involved in cell wall biosynthesis